MEMGHKKWCIPDLYVTEKFNKDAPSHECLSFANNGKKDALVEITAVFEDDLEPVVIKDVQVKSMRSLHFRLDRLDKYKVQIPIKTPYSVFVNSSENVVLSYARMNWIEGRIQSFGYMGYYED